MNADESPPVEMGRAPLSTTPETASKFPDQSLTSQAARAQELREVERLIEQITGMPVGEVLAHWRETPTPKTIAETKNGNGSQSELDLVQVRSLDSIKPAPENDDVYQAIAWDDPEISELARSIKERGLLDPILISRDGYIISGHRRRMAARIAELDTSSGSSGQSSRKP